MSVLQLLRSCVSYAFLRVCLFVPCGHLLGKGCSFGSRLWCITVSLSLSHWYPGSGVVLDCIRIPDLCTLTYFKIQCRYIHGSRVGAGGTDPPPLEKSQKYRVLSKTSPDLLKNRKATKPADDGPPLVLFGIT